MQSILVYGHVIRKKVNMFALNHGGVLLIRLIQTTILNINLLIIIWQLIKHLKLNTKLMSFKDDKSGCAE